MTRAIARLAIPLAALFAALPPAALADEGMWTLDSFPKKTVKEKYGFEPTDAWLERARLSSARIAGGCSGSFVSGSGLVMTNCHCVLDCLEEHSTAAASLTRDGFYAATRDAEKKCSDIEVDQLLSTRDVTAAVQGAGKGLEGEAFLKAQRAEMARLEKECTEGDAYRCDVVTLYHGGAYHLYRYRPFRDVRLVFAPEFETAFFGGDPDNFNFPRFNLDLAFLRVYQGDAPAATPHHFGWSARGPAEGDLVFVSGHPGSTRRLWTTAQLEYQRDVALPASLMRLSELRGLLLQFSRLGDEQKRISEDDLLTVENSLKGNRGRFQALTDARAFAIKERAERDLRARVAADPAKAALYGGAWDAVARAQEAKRRLRVPYSQLELEQAFRSDLYGKAFTLVRAAAERPKPNAERLREFRESALPSLTQGLFSSAPIHEDLEIASLSWSLMKMREELGPDDPTVKKILGRRSPEEVAEEAVKGTSLGDVEARRRLWDGGAAAVDASEDPMIRLARLADPDARAARRAYEEEVEGVERKNGELIARAFFEGTGPGTYPDATFTLRVTYGTVRGFPQMGRPVAPFTDFAGLFARVTGREPFRLPQRWQDARGRLRLDTPFNFTADTDIIGGNSGSPVFDRDANVVGLVFDGNLDSLGGDYWFDETVNRTVAVHSEGIVEALRRVYRADGLAEELRGGPAPGM